MSNKSVRAVVIGGGILGAAVSYFLARQHVDVVVLEQGELCSGASGGNLGKLSVMERDEPWHIQAALDSLAAYAVLQESGMDLELSLIHI